MAYTNEKVTWEQLCKLEPKLLKLYRKAKAVKDNGKTEHFCANRVWYGYREDPVGLKQTLLRLVGHSAAQRDRYPLLATNQAYDLAYEKIYDALPDCRNCACISLSDVLEAYPEVPEVKG